MKTRLLSAWLVILLAGCSTVPPVPASSVAQSAAIAPARTLAAKPSDQWLFGSAEAAVLIRQTYDAMAAYAVQQATTKTVRRSVVLAQGATLDAPRFADCSNKPAAVVFDADETLIWNMGQARWSSENDKPFDPKMWDEWERTGEGKVVPLPGAIEALAQLRAAGITVIANTNRDTRNAAQTAATLKAAGLGDFVHGETLFLKGDDATGSSKDARRTKIAQNYCVIAMVGDQLGDFAQGFNAKELSIAQRRALATLPGVAALWGKGWFLLPNPTYGPWDRATNDDIFPGATRWEPKEGR